MKKKTLVLGLLLAVLLVALLPTSLLAGGQYGMTANATIYRDGGRVEAEFSRVFEASNGQVQLFYVFRAKEPGMPYYRFLAREARIVTRATDSYEVSWASLPEGSTVEWEVWAYALPFPGRYGFAWDEVYNPPLRPRSSCPKVYIEVLVTTRNPKGQVVAVNGATVWAGLPSTKKGEVQNIPGITEKPQFTMTNPAGAGGRTVFYMGDLCKEEGNYAFKVQYFKGGRLYEGFGVAEKVRGGTYNELVIDLAPDLVL